MAEHITHMNRRITWTCPFFKYDGAAEISGECGRPKFHDKHTATEYMSEYCAGNWEKCSLAIALLKYYDEKETKK